MTAQEVPAARLLRAGGAFLGRVGLTSVHPARMFMYLRGDHPYTLKVMTAKVSSSRSLRRSVCPVACTLDLIGDKWTLLIIRDLFAGKSRYGEFLESPEKIATNTLADRLQRLTGAGLVATSPTPGHASGVAYSLTSKGKDLLPLLGAVRDWGLTHIKGTQSRISPRSA